MLEENNVRKGFLEHDAYKRLQDVLPEGVRNCSSSWPTMSAVGAGSC
jgi:hypothetical protein